MVTRCTACQVWFKVTREQLHAAHGLVRCSACGTVFNALATLRHEMPEAEGTWTEPVAPDGGDAHAGAQAHAVASEPADGPGAPRVTGERMGRAQAGEESLPAESDAPGHSAPAPWERSRAAVETGPERAAGDSLPPVLEPLAPLRGEPMRRTRRWLWGAALGVALLALAAQLLYAQRDSLAGLFGITLGQRIELDRYAISDATLDAAPDQPGALVLSGSLFNHAGHPQPGPLIRVTLTDRYGEAVGARVLTPTQYGAKANAAIKAHQRLTFHVKLADPGASAVGFSLVLCKHREHSVWCQGG